jgi:pimeloyl-ACP methyl ester carboxylesterase
LRTGERYIRTEDGTRLYYETFGDDPDVVVVPAACFLAPALSSLAEGRTLIFYDTRNRGRSDAVEESSSLTIDREVGDLEEIRRKFGLERFSLVGWSYLSSVTAPYAAAHPERIARLLLIGPMPLRGDTTWREAVAKKAQKKADPELVNRVEDMKRNGLHLSNPIEYCRAHREAYLPRQMGNRAAIHRFKSDPCV